MAKKTSKVKVVPEKKIWRMLAPLGRLARNPIFRCCYALFALTVLFATTLLWAVLGARLQGRNADQLSDPYLFSTWKTFREAAFPGAHTFLLKWPIFWLINVFGLSKHSLVIATVGLVVVTVATLVLILYKIERRPLVFGTICLGLSLALLLIPAQPYAGGLLPVNMAMLTTRNIEYAVYLMALLLFARAKRIWNWNFALGVVLLSVLIASDKLFMSLSLGGALLAMVLYGALRAWNLVSFALRWFIGGVIATAGATGILAAISSYHLTHIVNGGSASPYALVTGVQNVVLGVLYGVLGLFTNAGANPVYDNLVLRRLPEDLLHRLLSFSGPAYVAAAIAMIYALLLAWRLAWRVPRTKPRAIPPIATLLALALIWSTVAAFGVFIATKHYYEVDSRYLTISLFALVVVVAVDLRKRKWRHPEALLLVAVGLLVAIVLAVGTSVHVSHTQTNALNSLNNRNRTVAAALHRHKVDVLVGSYWRVLPVKLDMHSKIIATPLSSCTQPQTALTSAVWQPNLRTHSFAYLLTVTGSVAAFPDCSLATVVSAYGRPNASQIIAGTIAKPTEVLLFYDRGSHAQIPAVESAAPASILPVPLSGLNDENDCSGPTVMNVVAHEDDDLLFMNPDIQNEINAGDCMRTVFLTAGNDGQGRLYWLSRQLGSEAAYDNMFGKNYVWVQQTVEVAKNQYLTVASPRGNTRVTLIFYNLPDGNLQGQGFPMSNFESLAKLRSGAIKSMETVDGQSSYTGMELTSSLTQLMQLYRPSAIQTQADVNNSKFPDHSDHIATGFYAQQAAAEYDQREFNNAVTIPVKLYVGYPIHAYPSNLSGSTQQQKEATFLAYARFDGSVCHTVAQCAATPTYNAYLTREYLAP